MPKWLHLAFRVPHACRVAPGYLTPAAANKTSRGQTCVSVISASALHYFLAVALSLCLSRNHCDSPHQSIVTLVLASALLD